jgi:hypothetical protein
MKKFLSIITMVNKSDHMNSIFTPNSFMKKNAQMNKTDTETETSMKNFKIAYT